MTPQVKAEGIQNILALRGDPPKGSSTFEAVEGGFSCALDLVKYIRAEYGDHFGVTVAGYPEAHPDVIKEDPEEQKAAHAADLRYLKQKVDAGGEVVVTQLFYDVELFLKFVADCRDIGITCPIIPGLMPIQTYGGFKRMTGFCKTYVPPAVSEVLEGIKDNEEACRAYGIQMGVDMCRRMLAAGTPGVHLYSLNQDKSVVGILQGLGLVDVSCPPRALPWRACVGRRSGEAVRPLFWASRPRSYLARTAAWSGDGSDAMGALHADVSASAVIAQRPQSDKGLAARQAALAASPVAAAADLVPAFRAFLLGAAHAFPWSESGQPSGELRAAAECAAPLLAFGALVLDAGRALHCAPSGAAATPGGWGSPGGQLYQKPFLHAFVPAAKLPSLVSAVEALGGSHLSATAQGCVSGNLEGRSAVAWAVQPRMEIVQPLVADRAAFAAWACEAWALWSLDWAPLFPEEDATSRAMLQALAHSHVLFLALGEDTQQGDALFTALCGALQ